MTRRYFVFILVIILLAPALGSAQAEQLKIQSFPSFLRPGKTELLQYTASEEGTGSLSLLNQAGELVMQIREDIQVHQGANTLIWNGMDQAGQALAEGQYLMRLQSGDYVAEQAIRIGAPSPQISQLVLPDAHIVPGQAWTLGVVVNMAGKLAVVFHVADTVYQIFRQDVQQGQTLITWDGLLEDQAPPPGKHTLSVVFVDETGFPANQQQIALEVIEKPQDITDEGDPDGDNGPDNGVDGNDSDAQPAENEQPELQGQPEKKPDRRQGYHYLVPTAEKVEKEDYGKDFWRLPVGDYNEEAIWQVMLQPITVIWGKPQRESYKVRATPDDSLKRENIVGEIHYESQGLHVLETLDSGWTHVEFYNSSYGPNNTTRRGYGATDELIRGYVKTSELKVITPRTDYGILIDKLRQRLYVFKEGKIMTELVISTGVPTKKQPWNETPSGEYLMVSRTGDFNAGNLVCRMSMRINGGALIHEVPYILNEGNGYWDYSSQEAQLGKKASHGCIRVQRKNNSDGINMTWLWNNIKVNTKVLVWDDDHRYYDYPADELMLYYNPSGGKFYHIDQNCRSIKDRYLPLKGSMRYSELDNAEHSKLTPCTSCNPPLRPSKIDEINSKNGF